jgi:RecB family exonuclease
MKHYIVGMLSVYGDDLKLFKITAENAYEAVKKGLIELATTEEGKKSEIKFQNEEDYPKNLKELSDVYNDTIFSVIEVGSFGESAKDLKNK